MFEVQSWDVQETEYGYIIDDFYWSPKRIQEMFMTLDPIPHKHNVKPSYNGKYFKDMRHNLYSGQLKPIYDFLGKITKKRPKEGQDRRLSSNIFRMKDDPFHTYDTHYWWPHFDQGYTAIVYLNEVDDTGTNLYQSCDEEEMAKQNTEEHYEPWRPKEKYKLLHTFEPKFNRLVMFNGNKYCHGMNLKSNLFSKGQCRMNQVFFYDGRNQNP